MAKYDWNTFCNYVEFLAGEMASGTVHPNHDSELISWYHDSELISWYHDAFLPWDHYLNNIVLFYHDSPITRSHFMDPTDRAIKGFYCICIISVLRNDTNCNNMFMFQQRNFIHYVCYLNVEVAVILAPIIFLLLMSPCATWEERNSNR